MEQVNDISCSQIVYSNDPVMAQIEITYNDSFPVEERRLFDDVKTLVDENSLFSVYIIKRGDNYAGFITMWDFETFCYIEHFAIDSKARNGGIGGKTIELIKNIAQKPIVLEVELPVDDLSSRRISFYERMGFVLDSHVYFQPPYHKGLEKLEMRLMTTQGFMLNDELFNKVRNTLYSFVYGV